MKKGVYFTSMSVIIVFIMIFGYNIINENQKEKMGVNNFGKYAFNIIEKNIEGEKLKFFIGESVKTSKEIALREVKKNAGVFDVSNCEKRGDYLIITNNCDYSNSLLTFKKEFNEAFDEFLRQYGDYGFDDFDISFENSVLSVNGNEKINLEIESEKRKKDGGYIGEGFDSGLDVNILDIVIRYSEANGVPEEIIKAIIVQESGGRIDSVHVNLDESGNMRSTDYGIMQINDRAHPKFFDSTREDFVCDASRDVECNIFAGTKILRESFDLSKEGRVFTCTGKFYTGWDAALRGYNGWGCTGNNNYVEDVMEKIGQDVYFAVTRDVQITDVGTLTVDININEEVEYDFNKISEIIVMGKTVRDCISSSGDVSFCAAKESDLDYIFNVDEAENLLKFDVEETESEDIIRFALEYGGEDSIA